MYLYKHKTKDYYPYYCHILTFHYRNIWGNGESLVSNWKLGVQVFKMTQRIKVFATKAGNMSLIPMAQMVE